MRPGKARTGVGRGADELPHITVEQVTPELDGGRYPVKRMLGDVAEIGADIFKDGHDVLAARVRYRAPNTPGTESLTLAYDFNEDRWRAWVRLDRIGKWSFIVEAWTDRYTTWRTELEKKLAANQDVASELLEGANLFAAAARRAMGDARRVVTLVSQRLRDTTLSQAQRAAEATNMDAQQLMESNLAPDDLTAYPRELTITVDRERAVCGAWYEFFPRSCTDDPARPGTFRDAEKMLERVSALGFDVVYLPPIHPIGTTFRKGKNNALTANPDDVGSPWAIGSSEGGHSAIHPALGSVSDFDHFVARANALGLEVALDFALQCSPDHPWVTEHPEWFFIRPDGTIKYAENPPKKYQDIYPLNFWCDGRVALWHACRDVMLYWVSHGVKIFRVDNPHTKPYAFWEWAIGEVQREHPDVIFLAEAFTRPKRMENLAKIGFTQSYTYFTWKNTPAELREWISSLLTRDAVECYRANCFANTPDILTEYLQHGGRPAFRARLLLAATLFPTYGIYSGFELCEHIAVKPGSEEYLDSEKYQVRVRDWNAPGNLNDEVAHLNAIRREHAALQRYGNITFVRSENDHIFAFLKSGNRRVNAPAIEPPRIPGAREEDLLVIVNTDPFRAQETMVHVPVAALGIGEQEMYDVVDLMTGARYTWRGVRNFVRLDPAQLPGHLLRVERRA